MTDKLETLKTLNDMAFCDMGCFGCSNDSMVKAYLRDVLKKWIHANNLLIHGELITDGRMNDENFRRIQEMTKQMAIGAKTVLEHFGNLEDDEKVKE